jgi:oligopeptide transport system substrate-binding protein
VSPPTLDPARAQDIETISLLGHLFEGLVGWDEKNEIVPLLAEKWTISEDGKTYTFTLRADVKFHSGRTLIAEDVKWSFERNADPGLASPLAKSYLGDIVGVKEKLAGKRKDVNGVTVVDDRTIKIELDQPRAYFLGKLTYPVAAIMPKGLVPEGQGLNDPAQLVGTGPFKMVNFIPQQEVALLANAEYHGGVPKIERMSYRIVKDPATRGNLYRAKQLDILSLSVQDIRSFQADDNLKGHLVYADQPSINYVGMNGNHYPPFKDARVRRAFVMAVDRKRITETLLGGVGKTATGILPEFIPQVERTKPIPPFDPAAAKKLIAEAGYEGKLPPIELWVSDQNRDRKTIAEFVVGQITENLGVKASLRLAENSVIIQRATKRELGFFYGNWFADYLDAENFLSVLLSNYGQNRTAYDNPEFSKLTAQADVEQDAAKRKELYAKAEDLVLQDSPWIPLYHPQEVVAIQPWIKGWRRSGFGFLPHTQTIIEKS